MANKRGRIIDLEGMNISEIQQWLQNYKVVRKGLKPKVRRSLLIKRLKTLWNKSFERLKLSLILMKI